MRRWPVVVAGVVVVVSVVALAAFLVDGRGDNSASISTTTTTSTTVATTTTTTEATTTTAETGPAPTGLPDPQTLVGLDTYTVQEAPGLWRVFIDGRPTELAKVSGSCFQGPATDGDPCPYALETVYAAGPGAPAPADSALLLLEQFQTRLGDGTSVWMIVDAVITTTPDGEPAWLKLCDGEEAAAFYGSETVGGRYIATAAWSANPDATALDTVDPASITCYDTGD